MILKRHFKIKGLKLKSKKCLSFPKHASLTIFPSSVSGNTPFLLFKWEILGSFLSPLFQPHPPPKKSEHPVHSTSKVYPDDHYSLPSPSWQAGQHDLTSYFNYPLETRLTEPILSTLSSSQPRSLSDPVKLTPLICSKSRASPPYSGKSQSPFRDLWNLVSWYLFDLFSCYYSSHLFHFTSSNILTRDVPLSGSSSLYFLYSEMFFSQISSWLTPSFPSGVCSKARWWTGVFLGTLSNMAMSTFICSRHFPSHFTPYFLSIEWSCAVISPSRTKVP